MSEPIQVPAYGRHNYWRPHEYAGLLELSLTIPRRHLPAAYNRWAKARGYSHRQVCSVLGLIDHSPAQPPDELPWRQDELNRLRELVDDYPPSLLEKAYNDWAGKQYLRCRSLAELVEGARDRLQIDPITPTGLWVSAAAAAESLEWPISKVLALVHDGRIKGLQEPDPDRRWFVFSNSFIWVARQHPHLLAGASRFGVLALTSRLDLADRVAAVPVAPPPPPPRPVQCLETCRWWPTPELAAAATSLDQDVIIRSAENGTPTPAGTFRYVSVPARCLSR